MSSQVITPNNEAAILARMLESDDQELTPDAARYLLSIKLPPPDEDQVDDLSAKARAGSLTEAESRELDGYLHVASIVAVLQSKARRRLKQTTARQQCTERFLNLSVAQLAPPPAEDRQQARLGGMKDRIRFQPGWDAPTDLDGF